MTQACTLIKIADLGFKPRNRLTGTIRTFRSFIFYKQFQLVENKLNTGIQKKTKLLNHQLSWNNQLIPGGLGDYPCCRNPLN